MSAIDDLATRFWDLAMESSPLTATILADHRYDDRLDPVTDEEIEPYMRRALEIQAEAEAFDPSTLTADEELTRRILLSEVRSAYLLHETGIFTAPISPLNGFHVNTQDATIQTTIRTPEQAGMIAERLRSIPRYLEKALSQHRADVGKGRPPTAINIQRVLGQLDAYMASPMDTDPYLMAKPPSDWEGTDAWRQEIHHIVETDIRPAYALYREGIAEHIAPYGRGEDESGLVHLPEGAETYAKLIEVFTSLELDPAEIHAIGTKEATESLPEEYATIGAAALDTSDTSEIFDRIRHDPTLRYSTGEEMVEHAERIIRRAWEASPTWFGVMPEAPCAVVRIPAAMAPSQPPAYYHPPAPDGSRPGRYFINTHAPETRSTVSAESIAFHEAIPGHHFQVTIASELDRLPDFRRHAIGFAFAEGWGLYAERLADEMGLYSSDLDRLGMLSADSWRAGRLVVDTGLHHLGWTRQQAIDFLIRWTAVEEDTVAQEVDRYIDMPGQALSYKIGQREIFRLRRNAQQTLGSSFSLPDFHDVILTEGSVPLPVLAHLVDRWIAK